MKIICVHCGGEFSIRPEDLGGEGYCPHCKGAITLPKAAAADDAARPERQRPANWLDSSISGLVSLVLHMSLFVIVALLQLQGGDEGAGETEDVLIGLLPAESLVETPQAELTTTEVQKEQSTELETLVEVEAPSAAADNSPAGEVAMGELSPTGGDAASFDIGSVQIGSAGGGGGSWEGLIGNLRRNGLDIVICFDSTGSMGGEIDQVKRQVERIGQTLTSLIPKTRIGICTYRDVGDEYVTKGLPLTSSIQEVSDYLARIGAGGGGDTPEAVDEGLYWSTTQNRFRPAARKVILIFGDAPPHRQKLPRCLELAGNFQKQNGGIVSTVTCRAIEPLPEFYSIARAGGGEAFLTTDQRQIMTQLIVLVFGSKHRAKVLEAFEMLEK